MNLDWLNVPTEEPSITFPIGAVIEDEKGIYKVLEFQKQDDLIHKYRVEILTQKVPIPKEFKHRIDPKNHWLLILPQKVHLIRRHE
jgi:hypothetical protein